jgi:DNA polymerase/3'-5' exonuclease PolX
VQKLSVAAEARPNLVDFRLELPGVGQKIAKKIQEIIDTGQLERAEADRNDPLIAAVNNIAKVHGIGPKLAQKLVNEQGVRSIDDLRKRTDLTKHQQLGLKYFDAFEERIPRAEMAKWDAIVKQIGHEIDSDLIVAVVGS